MPVVTGGAPANLRHRQATLGRVTSSPVFKVRARRALTDLQMAWAVHVDLRYRRLASSLQLPDGFQRVHCYHIRKTGGTSLNHSFMALGGEDPAEVHTRVDRSPIHRTVSGPYVFVSFNRRLIEQGRYFYSWGHQSARWLRVPPGSFTITILRDPFQRVRSYYDYLVAGDRPGMAEAVGDWERQLTSGGFNAFLDRVPKKDLLRQLYMFSSAFDIDEAVENISRCSEVMFTEDYNAGVARLSSRLQLPLGLRQERVGGARSPLSQSEHDRLLELLEPEYDLLRRLRGVGIAPSGRGSPVPGDRDVPGASVE
jgi:hypothetical protein